jgi:hypothetical protein
MTLHRVQLMRDGKLDEPQNIEARAEKEAAEKLFGSVLFKQGPSTQIRAMVVRSSSPSDRPTLFYER